jgi:hypothetical protein
VANQNGRPIAPARKLVAAVVGTIAVFVMLFGLGMSSWAIVALGAAMLALAIGIGMVNVVRRGARAWVAATAQVKAVSDPPATSIYGRAELQMVIVAPGLPTSEVTVRDPRVPVAKWPRVGDTLPVTVDVDDMRRVRINWDEAEVSDPAVPPPPPYYDEDLPDDDLLGGDPEPPPWATRDRQWGRGPDEPPPPPPAPRSGDLDDEPPPPPVIVRDAPGGPIVEGQLVDPEYDYAGPLPQRARTATATRPADAKPRPRPRPHATATLDPDPPTATSRAATPGAASSGAVPSEAPSTEPSEAPPPEPSEASVTAPESGSSADPDAFSADPGVSSSDPGIPSSTDSGAASSAAPDVSSPAGSDAVTSADPGRATSRGPSEASAAGTVSDLDPEIDLALDGGPEPPPETGRGGQAAMASGIMAEPATRIPDDPPAPDPAADSRAGRVLDAESPAPKTRSPLDDDLLDDLEPPPWKVREQRRAEPAAPDDGVQPGGASPAAPTGRTGSPSSAGPSSSVGPGSPAGPSSSVGSASPAGSGSPAGSADAIRPAAPPLPIPPAPRAHRAWVRSSPRG